MNIAQQIRLHAAITAGVVLFSSGCASIISGRQANVAIDSYPSNAHVVIHDKGGREVASVNTPGVVSLKRNGRWLMPARYTATIEAPGYQTAEVPIRSTLNPWILGNVVVGGVPGLIVDDATGACWKPQQDAIHQQLIPSAYAQQPPTYPADQAVTTASGLAPTGPPVQTAMTAGAPLALSVDGPAQTSSIVPAAPNSVSPYVARGPAGPSSGSFYR